MRALIKPEMIAPLSCSAPWRRTALDDDWNGAAPE
jgi:hypothetical protein